jgi:protein-L-isoaspartate(D-aspartate) O-methyltransferase
MTRETRPNGTSGDRHKEDRSALLEEIAEEAAATASYTGRAEFSPQVMAAMARVPRERFIEPGQEPLA